MVTVNVGSMARADWLGPKIGCHMALRYIHQMKWVNSHNNDSTINIDISIIILMYIIHNVQQSYVS